MLAHRAATMVVVLGEQPPRQELWAQVLAAAEVTAAGMNAQQLANFAWGCGKLTDRSGECWLPDASPARRHVVEALACSAPAMEPQHVSNSLWALAKLNAPVLGDLRARMLHAAGRVAPAMKQQEVGNTLWALATLRVHLEGDLRARMLHAAGRVAPAMKQQEVSNTPVSYTHLTLPTTPYV